MTADYLLTLFGDLASVGELLFRRLLSLYTRVRLMGRGFLTCSLICSNSVAEASLLPYLPRRRLRYRFLVGCLLVVDYRTIEGLAMDLSALKIKGSYETVLLVLQMME